MMPAVKNFPQTIFAEARHEYTPAEKRVDYRRHR
jgi:hypothetical protein